MKIQYASDLHIEFDFDIEVLLRQNIEPDFDKLNLLSVTDSDVIILAGDIWYREYALHYAAYLAESHVKPVVIVYGNHDYWRAVKNDNRTIDEVINDVRVLASDYRANGTEVYFLENDSVVINDTRILGATMWTDYKKGDPLIMFRCRQGMRADFNNIGQVTAQDLYDKHKKSLTWLMDELASNDKTIVVTHHLPSEQSMARQTSVLGFAYFSSLEDMIIDSGLVAWIHGHSHGINDYMIGDTRILSNTRGYNGESLVKGFNPGRTIEV